MFPRGERNMICFIMLYYKHDMIRYAQWQYLVREHLMGIDQNGYECMDIIKYYFIINK